MIAIENVRLFQELEARTRELARSVGELKALGEVGQAVSSTLELETVLATIVSHAVQLSGTNSGVIYEYDEDKQEFHLRASHRMEEELVEAIRECRYDMERVLPGERRQPERQFKSLTYWKSGNLGPRVYGQSPRVMDIDLFWQFRFCARSGSWVHWLSGGRKQATLRRRL